MNDRIVLLATLAAVALLGGAPAAADGDPPAWQRALDNDVYKISLDVRLRFEAADFETLDSAQAYTLRTRLGIGNKPVFGFSAFAEVESVVSFDDGAYFDVVSSPNGKSPIADPEETELNRLYLQYENAGFFGLKAKLGRQRITLGDMRFMGNVGWRQNEQTFDAALLQTTFGVDGLTVVYGWIEEVHRIFGNDGGAGTRDFDSNSHFVNVSYAISPALAVSVFAYLYDFRNSPANSSDSYGFRLAGEKPLDARWTLGYAASYAFQTDAENNPVDYGVHYGNAEGSLAYEPLGTIGTGYEHLGSDQGRARFVTPLATAHKFNGFADVFLDNGGPNGLRDAYFYVAPKLPFGLAGKVIYHHFWADESAGSLGDELDFVLSKQLAKGLVVLAKGAWFEGGRGGPVDRWRGWLELDYSF